MKCSDSPFGVNLSFVKDAPPVIISCVTELEGLAKQKGKRELLGFNRSFLMCSSAEKIETSK